MKRIYNSVNPRLRQRAKKRTRRDLKGEPMTGKALGRVKEKFIFMFLVIFAATPTTCSVSVENAFNVDCKDLKLDD